MSSKITFISEHDYIEGFGINKITVTDGHISKDAAGTSAGGMITVKVGEGFLERYLEEISDIRDNNGSGAVRKISWKINRGRLLKDWISAGRPRLWNLQH